MILTRPVRLSAVGFIATCVFLLATAKPAQACGDMQIEVTFWLICASSGGVVFSCYKTTTRALVPVPGGPCPVAVIPDDPLSFFGAGGGGGGTPTNPVDQDADGKVDCWKNVSGDPTAARGDGFGIRQLNGVPDNHTGIDIAIPTGTDVRAGGTGAILAADDSWPINTDVAGGADPFGNFIVLNYDDGTQAQYFHLESVNVTNGQRVQAGEVIGTSNNTGRSSNAHLHYAVWKIQNHAGQSNKDFANFHDPEQHHGNCPATP